MDSGDFYNMDCLHHKGNSTVIKQINNISVRQVLLQSRKRVSKSWVGWFLRMGGLIHSNFLVVHCTQLERARSVIKQATLLQWLSYSAFKLFRAAIHVNNSLYWSCGTNDVHACCFFLALRLTTMSLDDLSFTPQQVIWLFSHVK